MYDVISVHTYRSWPFLKKSRCRRVAWYSTYLSWQVYLRWLKMKKRTALCVGAARAASAAER